MSLIVNGTEIENVIVIKRDTGVTTEIDLLNSQDGTIIWEKTAGAEFEVTRFSSNVYESSSSIASSFVAVSVTAGEKAASVSYGGITKTVDPNTTAGVYFGKYGSAEDDGTPTSGKMKISNAIGVAGYSFSSAKSTTSICNCITAINKWGTIENVGDNLCKGSTITSVVFSNSIRTIGVSAFETCTSLQSVIFENGATSIGNRAFYGCSALANLVFSNTIQDIGEYAFNNCKLIPTITLPSSLKNVGTFAFYNCELLQFSSIPTGVESIGRLAFSGCLALNISSIPTGIKTLGGSAFTGTAITRINSSSGYTIDLSGLTQLTTYENCFGLDGTALMLPTSLTYVSISADHTRINTTTNGLFDVQSRTNITSLSYSASSSSPIYRILLPNNISNMTISLSSKNITMLNSSTLGLCDLTKYSTFNASTKLNGGFTSVRFSGSLTTIPQGIFQSCQTMVDIVIPSSVKSILPNAFTNCGTANATKDIPCTATVNFAVRTGWQVYEEQADGTFAWKEIYESTLNQTTMGADYLTAPKALCLTSTNGYPNEGYADFEWKHA